MVAEIPAMGEVQDGGFHQRALRADASEEHHELELEEDERVDGGTVTRCVQLSDPLPDEGKVEGSLEMPVEVIGGNEAIERDQDTAIQFSFLGRTEHRGGEFSSGGGPPVYPPVFHHAGPFLR
jgi:hypothetical protein